MSCVLLAHEQFDDLLYVYSCEYCTKNHPPEHCPNNKPGICYHCGGKSHKSRNCITKLRDEAEKLYRALNSTNVGKEFMINQVRRDEDILTRVTASDRNDKNGL